MNMEIVSIEKKTFEMMVAAFGALSETGGRCGREWCANDACQFNGVSRTHEEGVLGKAHLRLKRINAGERAQCEDWKKHGRKGAAKPSEGRRTACGGANGGCGHGFYKCWSLGRRCDA